MDDLIVTGSDLFERFEIKQLGGKHGSESDPFEWKCFSLVVWFHPL